MPPSARAVAVLLAVLTVVLTGCGSSEVEQRVEDQVERVRRDVERRVERAQGDFEERRERFGRRIREVLADLDKVFQRPERTSPTVRSRGRNEPTTIDAFLTDLLQDIDRYWERTFATARLPQPRVRYDWVAPG